MRPIEFAEQTVVFAKNQPQYQPLPAHVTRDGEVITCWQLSWRERLRVLMSGKVWWHQLTFHELLQPQYAQVESPFRKNEQEQEGKAR